MRLVSTHSLPPWAWLCIGSSMVILSLIYLALILFRYQWLRHFRLMRVIWRWGRGDWSYPASRLGAFTGGLFILMIGLILMDSYFKMMTGILAIIFVLLIPFAVFVAIHDYNLHKKHDEILHKRRDA
jgi:hypothetical protein